MPNLGFTICHLASFSLGFPEPEGHLILAPPGQCSSECWSKLSDVRSYQGQLWAGPPDVWLIRCALRTRYVQLLSGLSAHRAALLVLFYHCRNVL